MRRALRSQLALLAPLLLIALAPSPSGAANKAVVGLVANAPALEWPFQIGLAKGMFKEAGLDFDVVYVPSISGIVQQVAAGSLDFAIAGLVTPLNAIDKGAPIAILRIEGAVPPYSLYAKKDIKRIEDLKGKTIMLGGVTDITTVYIERMLAPHGLAAGQYDRIYAGSTGDRYAALASGAVDAAILGAPFDNQAEAQGLTNLGLTMEYVKDMPFTGYAINRAWGLANKETVAKFLASYQKAIDFFYDDKNRDASIQVIVDQAHSNPADVAKSYDFFRKIEFFDRSGKVSVAKLETLSDAMTKLGELSQPMTEDKLILRGVTPVE